MIRGGFEKKNSSDSDFKFIIDKDVKLSNWKKKSFSMIVIATTFFLKNITIIINIEYLLFFE